MHPFAKILLAFLGLLVLAAAAWLIILQKRDHKAAITATARTSATQSVLGLTFEAPGEFVIRKLELGLSPELVESSEIAEFRNPQVEIAAIRTINKPDVELNFDNTIQAVLDGVAKLDGVRNVQHTVSELTVSGRVARQLSVVADRWDDRMRMEVMFIKDARAYYQVQVIFQAKDAAATADANQVMKSVRVAR
jgi:hypothetical protein